MKLLLLDEGGAAQHRTAGANAANDIIDLAQLGDNFPHRPVFMRQVVVFILILVGPEAVRDTLNELSDPVQPGRKELAGFGVRLLHKLDIGSISSHDADILGRCFWVDNANETHIQPGADGGQADRHIARAGFDNDRAGTD
ncbi:hypothetical protein D3C77_320120 [compost metagenome]